MFRLMIVFTGLMFLPMHEFVEKILVQSNKMKKKFHGNSNDLSRVRNWGVSICSYFYFIDTFASMI